MCKDTANSLRRTRPPAPDYRLLYNEHCDRFKPYEEYEGKVRTNCSGQNKDGFFNGLRGIKLGICYKCARFNDSGIR